MSNMINIAKTQLLELLTQATTTAINKNELSGELNKKYVIEIPSDKQNGDFATNIAMANAKAFKKAPSEIAKIIVGNIDFNNSYFKKCEIKGPGFINFFVDEKWFCDSLQNILDEKENYGRSNYGNGDKVQVEFVSANPTGPMHLGNARGGALGDCLASVLDLAGYNVTREFLINDAGNQIEKFGKSIYTRYMQLFYGEEKYPMSEDYYQGYDITEIAQEYKDAHNDELVNEDMEKASHTLGQYGLKKNVERLKKDLLKYNIEFDVWFSEQTLHDDGSIKRIVELLLEKDYAYKEDGAIWYRATKFGSEKDEVIIRKNGNPTYFVADIAYHYNKFVERQFKRVINIWGADHHGHVARLKGSMDAIGLDGNNLDVVLMQLVRLSRNGEAVRMSKRKGQSVTLSDLLDEIPVDAARFFFNLREPNVHLEFDLGLAVSESSQNPIYYIQYAHARICSIIKTMKENGVDVTHFNKENFKLLKEKEEIELIRLLASFTDEVENSAKALDPSKINRYAIEVATMFHKFYNACQVKGDNKDLTNARLALCLATKYVISNILTAFKISVPEVM